MKNYYSIQQLSKITGLSAHTLRYYEKIGLLLEVQRDQKGYRQYSEADLSWIYFLIRLRETGMGIEDMKTFSLLRSKGDSTIIERRKLLEKHYTKVSDHIKALQENLQKIEEKVQHYKELENQN